MNSTIGEINNIDFKSRYLKLSKSKKDNILIPLISDSNNELNDLITKSGLTNNAILKWFKETFGISAAKFFNDRKNKRLQTELTDFHNKNTPIEEVAKYYGYSTRWVYYQYQKFGLKTVKSEDLYPEIISLVKDGNPIAKIANILKCTTNKVRDCIDKHLETNIVNFRHKNNIKLQSTTRNMANEELVLIKKYFDAGYTIKETADLLNITPSKIYNLKTKHNIKSDKDYAHDFLEQILPDIIESKDNLNTISKIIGLSATTIARRIKTKLGISYREYLNKK